MLNNTTIKAMYNFKKGMEEFLESERNNVFDLELKPFLELMYCYNSQTYGRMIEKYFMLALEGTKNLAKEENGDFRVGDENIEFKMSYITEKKEAVSLVQVRLWQDIDVYLILAVDVRKDLEYHVFYLTKEEMEKEMKALRAGKAHGTGKLEDSVNTELRVDLKVDTLDWQRWVRKYRTSIIR